MKHTSLRHSRFRLTLLFVGVVLFLMLIFGALFLSGQYYKQNKNFEQKFQAQLDFIYKNIQRDEAFLEKYISRSNQPRNNGKQRNKLPNRPQGNINFIIFGSDGNIIFEDTRQEVIFDIDDISSHFFVKIDDMVFIKKNLKGGEIIVFYESIYYPFSEFLLSLLWLVLGTLGTGIFVAVIGYFFVSIALRPVAKSMDDMSDFIHNAGHELKTPLAVMRGNMQIMQAEKNYDTKLLQSGIDSVDHMNQLIEGLIELSEIGNAGEKTDISLKKAIGKIIKDLDILKQEKNIHIKMNVKDDIHIQTNIHELEVVLTNIIKNAILYNHDDGVVKIKLSKNTLSIKDTGIGMTRSQIQKIFDRFYRGGDSRNTTGFGIGLSLVKKIADANGWKIEVNSTHGKGSEFKIIF
ncbi:HAMP domain-containing histidine kinase [Candidatus Gracilibacteria bacterium]|nr:HAMP domain-containing histidine kinase [Candidatus Gracilibacteria bacterium]